MPGALGIRAYLTSSTLVTSDRAFSFSDPHMGQCMAGFVISYAYIEQATKPHTMLQTESVSCDGAAQRRRAASRGRS